MEQNDLNPNEESGLGVGGEKHLFDFALFIIVTIFLTVLGFLVWILFVCEGCYKSIIEPLLGLILFGQA